MHKKKALHSEVLFSSKSKATRLSGFFVIIY